MSGQARGGRASGRGKGGERQQFLFSVHHHPNFYDFFPKAIASFTGINIAVVVALVIRVRTNKANRIPDPIKDSFFHSH